MKSVSGKELSLILERKGWSLLRVHGSHYIFWQTGERCSPVGSGSRQQTPQDRHIEAFAAHG